MSRTKRLNQRKTLLAIAVSSLLAAMAALSVAALAQDYPAVYDDGGYKDVAIGGYITFGIDPNMPERNAGGAYIWQAIRDANANWNAT